MTHLRIPPFAPIAPHGPRYDPSSPGGAELLAERIARIWAGHGGKVTVRVESIAPPGGAQAPVFCIRSDMRGGLPQRWTR